MQLSTRRASGLGFLLFLFAGLAAMPVSADHLWPRLGFGFRFPAAVATITGVNATNGKIRLTDREGVSVILQTDASTAIRLDGKTAKLTDLKADDEAIVIYDRKTLVASRIEAFSPPPVSLTGTITGIKGNTVQVTTEHGTAVTLTISNDTRLRLNGSSAVAANLAAGDEARVVYAPLDETASAFEAVTPRPDAVSGAITGLDLTGGTLQLTPLTGAPQTIKLTNQTRFHLNGRSAAANALMVGDLATVSLQTDGSARVVAAQTPPLEDLQGTITALDLTHGTFEVTTPAMTSITLRFSQNPSTTIQRNGASATADKLALGDYVLVRYQYLLVPGSSSALQIAATSAP